jgi:hypothetical protein
MIVAGHRAQVRTTTHDIASSKCAKRFRDATLVRRGPMMGVSTLPPSSGGIPMHLLAKTGASLLPMRPALPDCGRIGGREAPEQNTTAFYVLPPAFWEIRPGTGRRSVRLADAFLAQNERVAAASTRRFRRGKPSETAPHVSTSPERCRMDTDSYDPEVRSGHLEKRRGQAADNRFDAADVWTAFQILGHRPELLETALRDAALGPRGAQTPGEALRGTADGLRERLWDDYESDYGGLTGLQRAVLARLVDMGAKFAPFSKTSLAAYGAETGGTVAPIEVQNALEDLRRKGIV